MYYLNLIHCKSIPKNNKMWEIPVKIFVSDLGFLLAIQGRYYLLIAVIIGIGLRLILPTVNLPPPKPPRIYSSTEKKPIINDIIAIVITAIFAIAFTIFLFFLKK